MRGRREAITAMRCLPPGLVIVMYSGTADFARTTAAGDKADHYVQKGGSMMELTRQLRTVMNAPREGFVAGP